MSQVLSGRGDTNRTFCWLQSLGEGCNIASFMIPITNNKAQSACGLTTLSLLFPPETPYGGNVAGTSCCGSQQQDHFQSHCFQKNFLNKEPSCRDVSAHTRMHMYAHTQTHTRAHEHTCTHTVVSRVWREEERLLGCCSCCFAFTFQDLSSWCLSSQPGYIVFFWKMRLS